jgi:hypothetical protein
VLSFLLDSISGQTRRKTVAPMLDVYVNVKCDAPLLWERIWKLGGFAA